MDASLSGEVDSLMTNITIRQALLQCLQGTLLLFCVCGFAAGAELSARSTQEIAQLISLISESVCVFQRNGMNYSGSEAVTVNY